MYIIDIWCTATPQGSTELSRAESGEWWDTHLFTPQYWFRHFRQYLRHLWYWYPCQNNEQPTQSSRLRLSTHHNLISTAGIPIVFSSLDTRKSIGEGWRQDWLLNQELCWVAEISLHGDTPILQSYNSIPVTLGALLLRPPLFVCFCTQFFKSSLGNTILY